MNQLKSNIKDLHSVKYKTFSFIIIMEVSEVENNIKELFQIQQEFALNLILIIFIKDLKLLINKKILTVNLLESMIFYCKNNILYNDKYCFSLINANNNNVYVNIDDKNFKLNINDFKDLLTKKYNDKNIVLI